MLSQLSLDSEKFQFSSCLACQNSMITASQADAHWFMQQIRAETEGGAAFKVKVIQGLFETSSSSNAILESTSAIPLPFDSY